MIWITFLMVPRSSLSEKNVQRYKGTQGLYSYLNECDVIRHLIIMTSFCQAINDLILFLSINDITGAWLSMTSHKSYDIIITPFDGLSCVTFFFFSCDKVWQGVTWAELCGRSSAGRQLKVAQFSWALLDLLSSIKLGQARSSSHSWAASRAQPIHIELS